MEALPHQFAVPRQQLAGPAMRNNDDLVRMKEEEREAQQQAVEHFDQLIQGANLEQLLFRRRQHHGESSDDESTDHGEENEPRVDDGQSVTWSHFSDDMGDASDPVFYA
eukprot:6826229-Prymnesium_polylepis.1